MVAKWEGKLTAPDATTLRFSKTVTNAKPWPVPGGYRARGWQVQVETAVGPVTQVALATDIKEFVPE
jgi:hypothetical protein